MERNKKSSSGGSDLLKIGFGLLAGIAVVIAGKFIKDQVDEKTEDKNEKEEFKQYKAEKAKA